MELSIKTLLKQNSSHFISGDIAKEIRVKDQLLRNNL